MYKRIINSDKNKVLSNHQYGFRKNRSTEHAVVELTDKISKAINEGKYTIGIFLDLSKAFDTVNHEILLKKLQHGIRGVSQKWFRSCLNERKQIVKYNQYRSNEMTITTGVPQGSILGPLLFLLYINDIENCSTIMSFVLYADDTNAFYSNSCINALNKIMQNEINKIIQWLNVNKLSINSTKTKFIIFKSKNKRLEEQITLKVNNEIIDKVYHAKFLGVTIDENLTWKNHMNCVIKQIVRSTGI